MKETITWQDALVLEERAACEWVLEDYEQN
jgi:hypothetical protein